MLDLNSPPTGTNLGKFTCMFSSVAGEATSLIQKLIGKWKTASYRGLNESNHSFYC